MKAVILAGGYGTRISEESALRPKPMIEIGNRPILWHIMKIYSAYGIHDFVVCCGYKGYMIKEYFSNYSLHMSDVTIDIRNGNVTVHQNNSEDWRITLVDTGLETMTGGRIKRIQRYVEGEAFCMTYGDGVSDVDIEKLVRFHRESGKVATLTAIQPQGRFGVLEMEGDLISSFIEKKRGDDNWINGGFFVLEPEVFNLLDGDSTTFEREPLEQLARGRKLNAYKHHGFWQPMDTMRDKIHLEELWASGKAPWKLWT